MIIRNLIKEKYDNNIIIPAAGKISRGNYIKDLKNFFDE
jgi:hypothetical protein